MMAFGQIESAWPVVGGVLVVNGVAYALAGRTTECDGGLYVCGLDPLTGKCLWSSRNAKPDDTDVGPYDPRVKTNYVGPGDLLSSDGKTVAIGGCQRGRFNCKTGQPVSDYNFRGPSADWRGSVAWMQSRYTRDRFGSEFPPVAYTASKVIVTRIDGKTRKQFIQKSGKDGWQTETPPPPAIIEALVVGGDKTLVAISNNTPDAIGGELWVLSNNDGAKLETHKLSAAPVTDGIATANGKVSIALQDGTLECLKAK
jgi:hypothetical protein